MQTSLAALAANVPDAVTMSVTADAAERLARQMANDGPGRALWGFAGGRADSEVCGLLVLGLGGTKRVAATVVEVGDHVEGRVTFGDAYEGPERSAHGGHIAMLFDSVCGVASAIGGGLPGRTATLSLSYLKPTPLNRPFTVRAEVVAVDGRKVGVSATLTDGDVVCARAEALMIRLR